MLMTWFLRLCRKTRAWNFARVAEGQSFCPNLRADPVSSDFFLPLKQHGGEWDGSLS